jgi:hypothetical protein
VNPDPAAAGAYARLYPLFKRLYFAFGEGEQRGVLPTLRQIAAQVRTNG